MRMIIRMMKMIKIKMMMMMINLRMIGDEDNEG